MSSPAHLRRPRRRGGRGAALHVQVGRRTAWLKGDHIVRLLDDARVTRRQWDHRSRRWAIPVTALDDLLAYAEHAQQRAIAVEQVDR